MISLHKSLKGRLFRVKVNPKPLVWGMCMSLFRAFEIGLLCVVASSLKRGVGSATGKVQGVGTRV